MQKNIDPKLKKIGEYLKLPEGAKFNIPEYQRPYSWGIDKCEKLWLDIVDFINSGNKDNYFFGNIIINCQENDSILSLLDGQQRTTTFLLLLKALLLRINEQLPYVDNKGDSKPLFQGLKNSRRAIMSMLYNIDGDYVSDEPDDKEDRKICGRPTIIENYSINELYKTEIQTILGSIDYAEAESRVIKIPRKQKDNKYTNFFRNFKFFMEQTAKLGQSALNIFAKTLIQECEIIEIRCWQFDQGVAMFNSLNSDGLPLYDSDIISSKLYAAAKKDNYINQFSTLWKDFKFLFDALSCLGIADIDSIFMQQMYYERAKGHEITKNGSINVTTPGMRKYFTEINKKILSSPVELCGKMINLAKIWQKVADYPIIQVLLKFNVNSKLFLASYFQRFSTDEITEEKIEEIASCLLRLFAVLDVVDTGYSSRPFKIFLFGELEKLADPEIPASEIKADFDRHISSDWNMENLTESVAECEKNSLVYLNEWLFAKQNGLTFCLENGHNIEHIMPVSGKNIEAIKLDAGITDKEDFENTVNKLGNKILLEEKINKTIGNEWFATKVSTWVFCKTGYKDSHYPIAVALVKKYKNVRKPYWRKEDIEKATKEAAGRITRFIFGKK